MSPKHKRTYFKPLNTIPAKIPTMTNNTNNTVTFPKVPIINFKPLNTIPAKKQTVTNNTAILSKVRIINVKNNTSQPSSHHQWQEPLMTVINGKNHWWQHCQWPNCRPIAWNTPALHAQMKPHFLCHHVCVFPVCRPLSSYETGNLWTAELLLSESATIMGSRNSIRSMIPRIMPVHNQVVFLRLAGQPEYETAAECCKAGRRVGQAH